MGFAHITVATRALQLPKDDMASMREKDMIRLQVKPIPADLHAFVLELLQLLLFRTLRDRLFMTLEAGFEARHAGEVLGLKIGMAGVALQPLVDMQLVVERDRLLVPGARPEINEKK